MKKQPVTIRIAYGVLKDLLKLPDDVEVLGIPGVNDLDGTFPLTVETPLHHVRGGPMTALYVKADGEIRFDGFAPSR